MKKLFSLLLALTLLSALLCGCGSDTTEATEDTQSESQTEGQPAEGTETVPAEKEQVALSKESVSEVKDQYKLSGVAADSGASYGYLKSTENDASVNTWELKEGYTPVAVRVTVENQQKEPVNFLDNIGCTIASDSGKIFIATAMQENPGQTADDGQTYPSTKAVPLEKGQSAVLWMIANIPNEVMNSGEGLHAYFMLGNGSMYDVDLRAVM